ncbi:MAG TPA: CARDB domain-containing protein [Thermoanaerobaculia bacterium]
MKSTAFRATALAATLLSSLSLFSATRPNTIKYKNSGLQNATGRSGSATLEARALLGSDGVTTIELTTGSFENGGATGTIAKVQLKAGGSTDNFNNLRNDGTAVLTVDGLGWREPVQIQANVRDRSARTEVVTVREVVKKRPDLMVSSISAPAQAPANVPVNIYATIVELNGDIGARANARLLVNGVEVDRAEFIWVDANGNVSVAFTHTFTTYGNVNLQVVVDGVNPGDWDTANNSATHALEVAESFDAWTVHAVERTNSSYGRSESPQWDTNNLQQQTTQVTDLWGWIWHPVKLEGFTLSTSASTDGRTIYDVTPSFEPFREVSNGARCTDAMSWRPMVSVCFQPDGNSDAPDGQLLVEVHYNASDAVYHSWGYDYSRHPIFPDRPPRGVYDDLTVMKEITTPLGNTVQWDLRLTDGDGVVYRTQPFLPSLQSGESHQVQPRRCGFSGRYGFTVCTSFQQDSYWREGWASTNW